MPLWRMAWIVATSARVGVLKRLAAIATLAVAGLAEATAKLSHAAPILRSRMNTQVPDDRYCGCLARGVKLSSAAGCLIGCGLEVVEGLQGLGIDER